ncbi:MAG: hypothetical protein L3J20_07040 [Flavobacteriaceae bacterium]|nr:hypothetical protein [Flavobacteriaceae bacterium]
MRKLQTVLVGVILLFALQFTLISCDSEDLEINQTQLNEEVYSKVNPANGGGGDDDDEDDGV